MNAVDPTSSSHLLQFYRPPPPNLPLTQLLRQSAVGITNHRGDSIIGRRISQQSTPVE